MDQTYLSIIVTSRNDNHGGDMLKRMSCFINNLIYQTNRTKFSAELIIVEWNTPENNPLLNQVLPFPKPGDYLSVRYIIVPPEIHAQYKHSDVLGLYQMIAKNVGIRRAKGEFILCTNIDILFSDKCFDRIIKKDLTEGHYYRANRCDVPALVMDIPTEEAQLKFSENNIMKRLGKDSRYTWVRAIPDFFYGFPRTLMVIDRVWGAIERSITKNNTPTHTLDTEACGDFTLMHRSDWDKIGGYAEIDLYSIHIDSMGLISATAVGIKQVVLPYDNCVYHIHHKDGWEAFETPVEMLKFNIRRPGLDWATVYAASEHIIKNKTNWGINKADWGFAKHSFQEISINSPE